MDLFSLPDDLIRKTLSFVDQDDTKSLRVVNKKWRAELINFEARERAPESKVVKTWANFASASPSSSWSRLDLIDESDGRSRGVLAEALCDRTLILRRPTWHAPPDDK